MSELAETLEQRRRYVAAREAAERTKPGVIEVIYKENVRFTELEGYFKYDPEEDRIKIVPERGEGEIISFSLPKTRSRL